MLKANHNKADKEENLGDVVEIIKYSSRINITNIKQQMSKQLRTFEA